MHDSRSKVRALLLMFLAAVVLAGRVKSTPVAANVDILATVAEALGWPTLESATRLHRTSRPTADHGFLRFDWPGVSATILDRSY